MTKFEVGDKVIIRKNLSRIEYNVVPEMEEYRGKVATIVGARGDNYFIDLDGGDWYWSDNMFEEGKDEEESKVKDKEEDEKFRAFLNEVARGDKSADNDEYYRMYSNLSDVVNAPNGDCVTTEEVNASIDELVEFYSSFEPKPTPKPKKMTLEEIEEELGYKIELVED